MEHNLRILPPEVLIPQLSRLLEQTSPVPLVISGNSMSPFLVHRRDTVYLSKVSGPLKPGDMILYQRKNGTYVLHRICKVQGDTYHLVGDGQWGIERGICREQVIAIVTAVRRKGKLLRSGSFWWEFFAHIWLKIIPLRPVILRLYSLLTPWRKNQ